MNATLRLEQPPGLKEATLQEAKWCLPFSFEVGEHRRGGRELLVRYKPRPDDPVDFSGPGPLEWISRAREAAAANSLGSSGAHHQQSPAHGAEPRSAGPQATSPMPAQRSPSDSYLELVFPFSRSPGLRELYQRFTTDRMRFGLLLEDIDTFAGDIAGRHASVLDRVLLTASIDSMSWLQDGEVTLGHDLKMAGQVVWAGRSSMEVMVELSVREPQPAPPAPPASLLEDPAPWRFVGIAFFVLVARTPDRTASSAVPTLVPETASEQQLFERGATHMQLRQARREAHWARRPPSTEEVALVHDLLRNHLATTGGGRGPQPPGQQQAVPMQRTVLQSSVLMHSQDRNVFDVIFGGHLLRLAFEHAFATAALYAGEYCDPLSMDDVAFLMPVPIGTLLRLTGQVVFTEGPVVRVSVRATKVEPGAPEQSVVTNTFSFAFRCPSGPVRRVLPESMVEAMEYVMGHRQHASDEASRAVVAAAAAAAQQPPLSQL